MESQASTEDLDQARKRVAARVRALRRERGWTQNELGHRLGLSQARLSEIERDVFLVVESEIEIPEWMDG